MKFKFFLGLLLFFNMSTVAVWACTSAIITGKQTKDGRPLMWKLGILGRGGIILLILRERDFVIPVW